MSEHNQQDQHGQHDEHDQEHHIVSPVIYGSILLALLIFTGLTVWMSFIDLGEWHIAISLFGLQTGLPSSGIRSSRWPSPAPR